MLSASLVKNFDFTNVTKVTPESLSRLSLAMDRLGIPLQAKEEHGFSIINAEGYALLSSFTDMDELTEDSFDQLGHYKAELLLEKNNFGIPVNPARSYSYNAIFVRHMESIQSGENILIDSPTSLWNAYEISRMFENPNDLISFDLGDGHTGYLMLDLNDNGKLDLAYEMVQVRDLLALDSNHDGLVSANDKLFKNLKVVIPDGTNNHKIVDFASVANLINIENYLGTYADNGWDGTAGWADPSTSKSLFMQYIDPVHTYDSFDNKQLNSMLDSMPQTDDGWVVRSKDTEEFFKNIGYTRKAADGSSYIQVVTSYTQYDMNKAFVDGHANSPLNMAMLEKELISRFDFLYNRYHELNSSNPTGFSKPAEMAFLEKEFERITHMNFSLKNLEKIKSNIAQGKITESFADLDVVVGIKQDGDNYLLRFNSGRTVSVSSLYFNTGDFIPFDGDKRASIVMPDQLGDGELTIDEADQLYETLAVKIDDKLTLLKDAGVVAIHKKEFKEKDRIALLFEMADGTTKQHLQLYKITDNKTEIKATSELIREILENPYIEKQSAKKTEIGVV